ncbi:MAG: hypothetical protein KKB21_04175 [Nanoarchaeota archaeon]|nr:hypothetical protein [Nanoarchaeota archaeon]
MKWPFKKRGKDVIDLTYLAKRGLLKTPVQEEYQDLTTPQTSAKSSGPSDSALSFLGAMASSAEQSPQSNSSLSANKIEDIEYKLETISKRVNSMIDRLDLVEKKLARDLRQSI